jgi:tyrosyl-tRNA synthetase
MARLQKAGHKPLVVLGGATGMIGDPSGKTKERQLLDREKIEHHLACQRRQMERLLDFDAKSPRAARMLDNRDWLGRMDLLSFLRDTGKHFTINWMLAKDSVKSRLGTEQGISFTEFSYMLLQAYDFHHLFRTHGCELQIGGSDQWGNITAGIELIRKKEGKAAYGLTCPLLTTASGAKFGKTAAGAVWLDPRKSSPYRFYQYWINTEDADTERFLKLFTFLEDEEIASLARELQAHPEKRSVQKRLAFDLTERIHGKESAQKAERASEAVFGGSLEAMTDADLAEIFEEVPVTTLAGQELQAGIPLVDLLVRTKLASSKSQARKLIQSGGAYLNNRRIADVEHAVDASQLATERMLVLRSGKKTHHLVKVGG